MEFFDELNFLSVIEEERESGDGDSYEELEVLKGKTDYQFRGIPYAHGTEITSKKMGDEKCELDGKLLLLENISENEEIESTIQDEKSNFKSVMVKENTEKNVFNSAPEFEGNEIVEWNQDEISAQSSRCEMGENTQEGDGISQVTKSSETSNIQNWFYIEPLDIEKSGFSNDCSYRLSPEEDTEISILSFEESQAIFDRSSQKKAMSCESAIPREDLISENIPVDDLTEHNICNVENFSEEKGSPGLKPLDFDSIDKNSEIVSEEVEVNESGVMESSLPSESRKDSPNNLGDISDKIPSNEAEIQLDAIFGMNDKWEEKSEKFILDSNTKRHESGLKEYTSPDETCITKVEKCKVLDIQPSVLKNAPEEVPNKSDIETIRINLLEICHSENDENIDPNVNFKDETISVSLRSSEKHNFQRKTPVISDTQIINDHENISDENGHENGGNGWLFQEDSGFRDILASFVQAELEENSDNFDITFHSLDILETHTSLCHESEELILEAPEEFRNLETNMEVEGFMEYLVPPPQPPWVPEREPLYRDFDNTSSTETGDTNQRSNSTLENKAAEENKRIEDSKASSTDGASLANSTGDNDHVKLDCDSTNVNAFEHVGNDAPIQRHDMLQIDHGKRETTVEQPEVSGAIRDLKSYRSIGNNSRSVSFSGSVNCGRCDQIDEAGVDGTENLVSPTTQCTECDKSEESSMVLELASCLNALTNKSNYLEVSDILTSEFGDLFTYAEEEMTNIEIRVDGEHDNNNNCPDVDRKFKKIDDIRLSTDTHDLANTSSPSSTPASSSVEERRPRVLAAAHLSEYRCPKLSSSIHAESGVPAPAPGCSPTKTAAAKGCVGSTQASDSASSSCVLEDREDYKEDADQIDNFSELSHSQEVKNLRWSFKNGRLVFDSESDVNENNKVISVDVNVNEVNLSSIESTDLNAKLSSKEINKRINENKSRLKYLEEKLKKAGISDDSRISGNNKDCTEVEADVAKQVVDVSESTLKQERKENLNYDSNRNVLEVNEDELLHQGDDDYEHEYGEELTAFTVATENIIEQPRKRKPSLFKNVPDRYREVDTIIRRKIKEAKEKWTQKQRDEAERLHRLHDSFNFHKKVKEITGTGRKTSITMIKNEQGKPILEPDELKRVWK
ncbi:hypothetical protein HHI36_006501 [Cryptolaemus montrouzieri]|uniref:Uncharacterized protein n=1 Tax=Cryptolaemus montrouzieri TaxID=559131 RepID=A0ABD2NXE4_9CUCU